ncbi:MAG: Type fimbrial biosis protein PilY1, partial [Herminiimonas sp.]|nr:Type fimbrial biosis protein PilY1 [Herminiimonas sp.]
MPANGLLRNSSRLLLALALSASAYAATDISTVPLNTYSAPSTTDVKPNVLFVLDDSGSMDWNYMPDWANDNSPPQYLFRNNAFNGVAYNPAVRYAKPVSFNSDGTVNTTAYPNMIGASGATGADATTKPNWKAVKNDGYGIQSTGTSDLTDTAYSFTIVPGEYCNSASMRTCVTANAPTGNYTVPAYLRWCSDNALTNCRATYDATFNKRRAPSPRTATLIISGSSSTSVSGLTVGGVQIMAAAVGATSNTGTLAQNIAAQIDACTFHKTGACQAAGYSASSSGSVVTITAPDATGSTPQVTRGNSGTMVFTATAFAMGAVPGENLRTPITPGTNSYAFPGKNVKALARTDCAGTTCTYVEEMSNYANWWAYYRTRMQMMKTGASNAFSTIDVAADITNNVSRFRLGYMSINNNTGSDFLNLAEFKTSHKFNWYNKLLNARPNDGTPLRAALSKAGHLYAGKLTGTDLNGVRVDEDPLQYSCQQNYAILSTDGFWNGGAGYKLDDAAVGNQDAALPRPLYDGGSATVQMRTSTLQEQTIPVYLQIQTSMLQTRTGSSTGNPLQRRDSNNGGSTYSNWYDVASCSADNNGNSRVQCRGGLERRDSGDFGVNFGSWYQVSSCTAVTSGRNQVQCQSPEFQRTSGNSGTSWTPWYPIAVGSCDADSSGTNRTECRTGNWTNWTNTASCTTAPGVECQYAPWSTWTTTNSCDRAPQSAASPYTVGIAADCRNQPGTPGALVNASTCTVSDTKNCQYTGWTSWSSVSSCTDAPQSTAPSYTVGTARECRIQTSGGTSNTLADVAAYYYGTDLRSSVPG